MSSPDCEKEMEIRLQFYESLFYLLPMCFQVPLFLTSPLSLLRSRSLSPCPATRGRDEWMDVTVTWDESVVVLVYMPWRLQCY